MEGEIQDCTAKGAAATPDAVELVVRLGERYGTHAPGTRVLIDLRETRNASTMSALCTADEYTAALAKIAGQKAPPKEKSAITKMVERALAAIAPREPKAPEAPLPPGTVPVQPGQIAFQGRVPGGVR